MDLLDVDIESHRQVCASQPSQTAWIGCEKILQDTLWLNVPLWAPVRVCEYLDPRR